MTVCMCMIAGLLDGMSVICDGVLDCLVHFSLDLHFIARAVLHGMLGSMLECILDVVWYYSRMGYVIDLLVYVMPSLLLCLAVLLVRMVELIIGGLVIQSY